MHSVQLVRLFELCVNKADNTGNVDESLSDAFSFQNGLKHGRVYDHCFSILLQNMPLGKCKNTGRTETRWNTLASGLG
jgi:hypothetical protein